MINAIPLKLLILKGKTEKAKMYLRKALRALTEFQVRDNFCLVQQKEIQAQTTESDAWHII